MNEEQWQAIVSCDATYDSKFYYGVATTGIFCRPSCKSRTPARRNAKLFGDADEAIANGFRPCKRCKPEELMLPSEAWVAKIATQIEERLSEPFTLEALAARMHGSPYHLQRTFKQVRGVTPAQYAQVLRIERAKALLEQTEMSVAVIAAQVGLSNAAHFATVFQSKVGLSPTRYRRNYIAALAEKEEGAHHYESDATIATNG
ncbi:bifunctional transcriptional activator/DNA repair enzyme AdaA [Cohnella yongneupensis]|uniref:Bifunctional transcriptional activator/DNA repair enzyme AdaA n=1 Tax=Cohnella yongneupensis TaxID=425006 RepID=A0ABW0R0J0_9BACL